MLSRAAIISIAGTGICAGASTWWGLKLWNKQRGFESELWEDHVENNHAPLQELAPGLFQVSAAYYSIPKYRNMTLLRLANGELLVHSPIALPEAAMSEIEQIGQPKFLFVANDSTSARVDLKVFQKRYPGSKIVVPQGIAEEIKEHVPVDGFAEAELKKIDPGFLFIEPPLKDMKDTIIDAPLKNGQRALIVGELLWNIRFFSGLFGKLFVLSKLAGDGIQPQVSTATHSFGFPSTAIRTQFFRDFAHYADGHLDGVLEDGQKAPRYAALTMQHGNPVLNDIDRKLLKVCNAETQSL